MTDTATPSNVAFDSPQAALQAVDVARAAGRAEEELAAAEAAAAMAPGAFVPWMAVAGAARRAGKFDRMAEAQARAIETATDPLMKSRLEVDYAWTLANSGRWGEAAALARKPRPEIAHESAVRSVLGATLASIGAGEEAVPHLEAAARAAPARPDYWFNLAVAYNSLGRSAEALRAAERAIQASPTHMPAYELKGQLQKATPEQSEVARLQSISARAERGPAAAKIDFVLFKQLDELDRKDEAWEALERANRTMADQVAWSAEADKALADAMAAAFPRSGSATRGEPRPVFIVGLPRTGTTLLERMFAAHSQVDALGELQAMGRAVRSGAGLKDGPYMDIRVAEAADRIDWDAAGRLYRDEARALSRGAPVVTDKMPPNWWYAGAIAAALPDAVIVHVRRNPMDALFGAWKMSFGPAFEWAYRFEDLASHYGVYRRLTHHWRTTLGEAFVDVDYEALVGDPASVLPGLLEACGLAFEEACLQPHLAAGAVNTPSAGQVREPVSSGKVEAWRRYTEQLEPLRALLEKDGWVDRDGAPTA